MRVCLVVSRSIACGPRGGNVALARLSQEGQSLSTTLAPGGKASPTGVCILEKPGTNIWLVGPMLGDHLYSGYTRPLMLA